MRTRASAIQVGITWIALVVGACSSGTATPIPATVAPSASALIAGPITLQAPPSAKAGATLSVGWTGDAGRGDYLAIVPAGATRTFPETPQVDASKGNPATLTAPAAPGAYEIWFVTGDTQDQVKARATLTVE